ncbi:MAG: DeoR family transcriptional regulator [Amycolatopsis sp.]|jgi:DeoR/GlpR family transcriptional regulator of sugar metabolism|nr:DeoR family transcriptional regulator [Amycolatopsis sp.]
MHRQSKILELLTMSERVGVAEFARELGVSEVTVRRDLTELETLGALKRVHGGAMSAAKRGEEVPFNVRKVESAAEKSAMARLAGSMVRDGELIAIDGGTTGAAIAAEVAHRRITAMPLSVQGIEALSGSLSVSLLLPGGAVRRGEGSIIGPLAEQALAALRFDTYFLTCCGLNPKTGLTAHDLQDAAVKRAALASSARIIVVADGTKFARTAMALICMPEAVDLLITDISAPPDAVSTLRSAGVRVEFA